jgi:hypothetical protein
MRCPYTDIGCWHIDDVSHDCEATNPISECPHRPQKTEEKKEKKNGSDND